MWPQVKAWAGNRIKLYYGRPTAAEQIAMTKNLVPFWRYVVDLVSEKARHPQDDLTSDLIHLRNGDDSVLTLNEIASCMITLLVAGHETTTRPNQQRPAPSLVSAGTLASALRRPRNDSADARRNDAL